MYWPQACSGEEWKRETPMRWTFNVALLACTVLILSACGSGGGGGDGGAAPPGGNVAAPITPPVGSVLSSLTNANVVNRWIPSLTGLGTNGWSGGAAGTTTGSGTLVFWLNPMPGSGSHVLLPPPASNPPPGSLLIHPTFITLLVPPVGSPRPSPDASGGDPGADMGDSPADPPVANDPPPDPQIPPPDTTGLAGTNPNGNDGANPFTPPPTGPVGGVGPDPAATPEPLSLGLSFLGLGALGVRLTGRRRRA
jgi:hypothetical protein